MRTALLQIPPVLLAQGGSVLPAWADQPVGVGIVLLFVGLLLSEKGPLALRREVAQAREEAKHWRHAYEILSEGKMLEASNTHEALEGNKALKQLLEALQAVAEGRDGE